MLKDTKRPNGTVKRIQWIKAHRGGVSSMGTPYKKGDAILHMSSSRCTGETYVLAKKDLIKAVFVSPASARFKKPGTWSSKKQWSEDLTDKWHKENCWLVVSHGEGDTKCPLGENAGVRMNDVLQGNFGEEL